MVNSSSPPCNHGPGLASSETGAGSISRWEPPRPATSSRPSSGSAISSATVSMDISSNIVLPISTKWLYRPSRVSGNLLDMTPAHPIGPVDATRVPRYAGPPTFARLPRTDEVTYTDVAVVGVPFDSGVSYRPGARFGPGQL